MCRTVLVVEDDADLRQALGECLEDAGYEAVLAEHAEHALKLIGTVLRPCVVLLDYLMPGLSADGFLDAIHEREGGRDFTVVLMSGMAGAKVQRPERVAYYLRKPFDMSELLVLLERHCGKPQPKSAAG